MQGEDSRKVFWQWQGLFFKMSSESASASPECRGFLVLQKLHKIWQQKQLKQLKENHLEIKLTMSLSQSSRRSTVCYVRTLKCSRISVRRPHNCSKTFLLLTRQVFLFDIRVDTCRQQEEAAEHVEELLDNIHKIEEQIKAFKRAYLKEFMKGKDLSHHFV